MAKGKGSSFERKLATDLSLWWSGGKHDDIFWRSTTSGARATVRGRSKKRTAGQGGDIAATHESGKDLMLFATIEAKRGYSGTTFIDAFDKGGTFKIQQWEKFWQQAKASQLLNQSLWCWLITRRDRRRETLFAPLRMFRDLRAAASTPMPPIQFKYNGEWIGTFLLDEFLYRIKPNDILAAHNYRLDLLELEN